MNLNVAPVAPVATVAAPAAPGTINMGIPTGTMPMGIPTGAMPMGIPTGAMPMGIPTEAMPMGVPTGAMHMGNHKGKGGKFKKMRYADVKDNGFSLSGSFGGFSGVVDENDNTTICDSRGHCMVKDALFIEFTW